MGSGASGNRALVVPRAFESALRGGGRNGFLGCWSVPHASITLAMAPSAGSGLEARPSRPNFINFAGQKASPGRSKRPSAFGSGPLRKRTSRTPIGVRLPGRGPGPRATAPGARAASLDPCVVFLRTGGGRKMVHETKRPPAPAVTGRRRRPGPGLRGSAYGDRGY